MKITTLPHGKTMGGIPVEDVYVTDDDSMMFEHRVFSPMWMAAARLVTKPFRPASRCVLIIYYYVRMAVKRTTIELDEVLAAQAVDATGKTLRATVEQGLRLLISQSRHDEQHRQDLLDRHLTNAARGVDFDVLLSGEAWR